MSLFGGRGGDVALTFTGKDQLSPVVRNIRSAMRDFKKDAITGFGLGAGLNIFNAAQRAIGGVTDALGDSLNAVREDERSQTKLRTALEANVTAWAGNTDAIEGVLAARMRLGFSDDEQRDSLAQLVAVTQDVNEALKVQGTAMDLARLRGMSLADASQLLGKVWGGNVGILTRYGIKVQKGATATQALAEVQKRAGGQAKAWAEDSANAAALFDVKVGELQESVGRFLEGPAAGFVAWLSDTVDGITGTTGTNKALAAFVAELKGVTDATATAADDGWGFGELDRAAQDILQPARDEALDFADSMKSLAIAAGATREEVYELFFALKDPGGLGAEGAKAAAKAWLESAAMFDEAGAMIASGVSDMGQGMRSGAAMAGAAAHEFEVDLESLTGITKGSLGEARKAARVGMAEIAWAMKHPLSQANLADFYRTQINKGTRAMHRAEDRGFTVALAKATAFTNSYITKLEALDGANISISGWINTTTSLPAVATSGGGGPATGTGRSARLRARWAARRSNDPDSALGPGRGRASGGAVNAGEAYTVGERGPEVLVMGGRSGHVVPNGGMRPIVIQLDGKVIWDNVNRRMGREIAMNGSYG